MSYVISQDWKDSKCRSRVDKMRVGTWFRDISWKLWKVTRHESNVTYVEDGTTKTFFGNCAEGVPVGAR